MGREVGDRGVVRSLPTRARAALVDRLPRESLQRPGARARFSAIAVVVVLLCCLPAIVGALPVSPASQSTPELLEAVRQSGNVPFTGLVVSRGTLNLPDISTLGNDTIGLLSNTTRMRVWQAGANRFRVDRLNPGGETDVYVSGAISLTWDSGPRRLTRDVAKPQIPLPKAPDVLPTELGRQVLAQIPADGAGVSKGEDKRIAGRAATGLVWRPKDPRSLVGEVRLWVDPTNGLPLRVVLEPVDSKAVAFETSFLDLSLTPPDPDHLRFHVRGTQRLDLQDTPASSPQDLNPNFLLPPTIGGLPQRSPPRPFIATYGSGAALVAVTVIDNATAESLREQIDSPGRPPIHGTFGEGTLIEAPMLRALIFSSGDRGYVLAGTVTLQVLEQMALDLEKNPPPRNSA